MTNPELDDPALTHRQILLVFSGLMLGMLVAALSQTVVATALPTIVGELGGQNQLAWVVSAALLTSTASTPLWGKISDLYGRKLLFQIAIIWFLVGSALAGLSQNMPQLVVFRALQGVGMGGLMALAQAIIGDIVSPRQRGRYQGYMGSVFAVSSVGGPLLGGFLVDGPGWRWCFYIGIPIGIVALVVTNRVLRLPVARRQHAVDYLGATLLVGGVSALLLVTSLGGSQLAWDSPTILGLAAAAVVLLVLAGFQERRHPEPILPPRLFRNRVFMISSITGFVVGAGMFGAIVYLPQYLQIVKGQSPTASGLLTVPLMAGMLVTSVASGRIISRTGRYKIFPLAGLSLITVGLVLFTMLDVATPLPVAAGYMIVLGVGMGMVMQVIVLAVQNSVAYRDLGVATSAVTFFRSLGGALGVAVFGAILSAQLATRIPRLLSQVPAEQLSRLAELTGGDQNLSALLGSPAFIHRQLPEAVRAAVITGFSESLSVVFASAIPFALLGLVAMLRLEEVPLRHSVRSDEPASVGNDAGAAFETAFDPGHPVPNGGNASSRRPRPDGPPARDEV